MVDLRANPLRSLVFACLALFTAAPCPLTHASQYEQRMGLSHAWTDYPNWENAFLSGNGRMGIMVFGNPLEETVIFNDRGFNLSNGSTRSFATVSGADLRTIRDECASGDFADADNLAATAPQYRGGGDGSRHPGFGMFISIPPSGEVRDYSRTCDFRTGEITVQWGDTRGDWSRKAFVSRADDVAVQLLTAPTSGALSCAVRLGVSDPMGLPKSMVIKTSAAPAQLAILARYNPRLDAGYEGTTRVIVTGGTCTVTNDVLHVDGARALLLLTRTAKYRDHCEAQWGRMGPALDALPADYTALLRRHLAIHQSIYDRVRLDLGATAQERAKTNEELLSEQMASPNPVPALWERIFDAGRYYFLSASGTATPPDLLGIWTADCRAGWGGYYHLDANLNLQIGGGNIGDMPEAMQGYFALNEAWRADFETNARKLLGCRGLLACGNSPGPQSGLMASINHYYPYQYATGEEGWLLYPFWEHYLVTGDRAFLRDQLYPLLREMADFYADFLVKKDEHGNYIFAGSVSPENQPSNVRISLVNNSVFDISGARFLLSTLIQAANILGRDQGAAGVDQWKQMLEHLPPYLINKDGALQEWAWPGLADNYGHRHSSHLLPAWPYREITPEANPALYQAACVALAKKDAQHIIAGHGLLHDAYIAAVLKKPEAVRSRLLRLMREGYFFDNLFTSHNPAHGIFCADVCDSVPAIMMEMLVSSEPGRLEFLPALPAGLDHGSISGVKSRCRVTVVKLAWDKPAKSVSAVIKSDIDQKITIIERHGIRKMETPASAGASPLGEIAREVQLRAGVETPVSIVTNDF